MGDSFLTSLRARFPLGRRTLLLGLVLLGAFITIFLLHENLFSSKDIVLTLDIPSEIDVGSPTEARVTLTNSTSSTLQDGTMSIDAPDGITVVKKEEESFSSLASRKQTTATFTLVASGEAGALLDLRVAARFRPSKLSAVIQKEQKVTVRLRQLPVDLSFSFPSDVSSGRTFTFSLRLLSHAGSPLGPVGIELYPPNEFKVARTSPSTTTQQAHLFWDVGILSSSQRDEVAVTGSFNADAAGGEFRARIGLLDETRHGLSSAKEVKEYLNLRAGAAPVDIIIAGQENPRELVVVPGDPINLSLRYRNASSSAIDDFSVLLAFAHAAIDPRKTSSSERFTHSISGEYLWDNQSLAAFHSLLPSAQGAIDFGAKLDTKIPIQSYADTNQTIIVRARTMSGGRILGEKQVLLKIHGQLSIDTKVRYDNAPGGNNRGPIPPRVGQTTTYTVTTSIIGGSNGLKNTTARFVLGPSVLYDSLLEPRDANVTYDEATREVRWVLGDLLAGAGILSSPPTLSFRIALTPRQEEVGKNAELLTSITATAEDSFTGRTIDASDKPVDTSLPDDFFSQNKGLVEQ